MHVINRIEKKNDYRLKLNVFLINGGTSNEFKHFTTNLKGGNL